MDADRGEEYINANSPKPSPDSRVFLDFPSISTASYP